MYFHSNKMIYMNLYMETKIYGYTAVMKCFWISSDIYEQFYSKCIVQVTQMNVVNL